MGEKDIGFDADMEDSVKITADAALMELVWNNLLSNAVKFTEPGGTIKLTEQSDDSEIRVSVEDNGCGMTEETRKHILKILSGGYVPRNGWKWTWTGACPACFAVK